MDEYLEISQTDRFPFMKVLYHSDPFPDNIEQLGYAARDSVRLYRSYLALGYVDVIEFGGTHIQKFYAAWVERYISYIAEQGAAADMSARLRSSVSPVSALLLTARMFFNYFSLEILFGVDPSGKNANDVVKEMADVIRNGICAH
jgi:hypothetical protein